MAIFTKNLTNELIFNNFLDEQCIANELNQTDGLALGQTLNEIKNQNIAKLI